MQRDEIATGKKLASSAVFNVHHPYKTLSRQTSHEINTALPPLSTTESGEDKTFRNKVSVNVIFRQSRAHDNRVVCPLIWPNSPLRQSKITQMPVTRYKYR